MSMLQQILRDMFIDPELLNELSDDQRQLLFVKMREEQVRRWLEMDEKYEAECKRKPKKPHKPERKKVDFLKGNDGNEWVWVMGDHRNDRSIDQMMEEEAQEKARLDADKEAEQLKKKEEAELKRKLAEEEDRLKKELLAKEAEIKRKAEEAAMYQSLKEARLAAQKLEEERQREEKEEQVKLRLAREKYMDQKKLSVSDIEKQKNRMSNELYIKWKSVRKNLEQSAEEDNKILEKNWKEQEQKSKEAEMKMKLMAQSAREEHRRSIDRTNVKLTAVRAFQNNLTNGSQKPALPPKQAVPNLSPTKSKQRPLRPDCRQAVVAWFKDEEKIKGSGTDPASKNIALWFHGIISREGAEKILLTKAAGAFLVRVSEKVWGYTISYRTADRCKHFLVDTSDGTYQFFGNHQISHVQLGDLVNHHKKVPITKPGNEILEHPCGQESDPPDYWELFHGGKSEFTTL